MADVDDAERLQQLPDDRGRDGAGGDVAGRQVAGSREALELLEVK